MSGVVRSGTRLLRTLLSVLVFWIADSAGVEAHPHVWVDYILTLQFKAGRVVGLHEDWTFDEDFTAAVLRDVAGEQQVTSLSKEDVAKLEADAFSNLKNYSYFTHVWEGDTVVAVKQARQFQARLAAGKLAYAFTLTLARPVDMNAAPASFGVWDDTYYVDLEPAKGDSVRLDGDHAPACRAAIVADHQHPIYFGSVYPMVVRVNC